MVILENIGEGDDALICMTELTACCRPPYTSGMGKTAVGNWFFPNGTRLPSSGVQWDFHRMRDLMEVSLHRRRGGEEGIYRCMIPDTMNVNQTIYIGVYSASTGEWFMYTLVLFNYSAYVSEERVSSIVKYSCNLKIPSHFHITLPSGPMLPR